MVLLIIIPMKNGYFIGNIPHFQLSTHIIIPYHTPKCGRANHPMISERFEKKKNLDPFFKGLNENDSPDHFGIFWYLPPFKQRHQQRARPSPSPSRPSHPRDFFSCPEGSATFLSSAHLRIETGAGFVHVLLEALVQLLRGGLNKKNVAK